MPAIDDSTGIFSSYSKNEYRWLKDENSVDTTNVNKLVFDSLTFSDAGIYTVEVRNDSAPDLTLKSHEIRIEIQDCVPDTSEISGTICQGANYQLSDISYNKTGSYKHIYKNSNGCDSIVQLDLRGIITYRDQFNRNNMSRKKLSIVGYFL